MFIRQIGIIFGLVAAVLLGGGFLAASGYLSVVVTIIHKQNWLMISYVSEAVIALVTARSLVISMGAMGGALLYTNIVLGQLIILGVIFVIKASRK